MKVEELLICMELPQLHVMIKGFRALSQNCEKAMFMSSCVSVHPHGTTGLTLDGFS
jgi:hypothetical protein